MAVEKFTDAGIFYNGWNLTGQSNQVSLSRNVAMLDTSVFGVATRVNSPGQDELKASVSGWWLVDPGTSPTSGAGGVDPGLYTQQGVNVGAPFTLYPKNEDLGIAYMFPATVGTFNFFGNFGELAPFTAEFEYTIYGAAGTRKQPCRGYLGLQPTSRAAASGAGTAKQLSAALGSGDWAVLCIQLLETDATGVVFELVSGTTASPGTSRISSGSLATDGATFYGDLQGPIATDTYYAIKWTRTGGTGFTACGTFGVTTPQGLGT